jgi:redox-sensitive bicupin YhaK (pirin superfamily)
MIRIRKSDERGHANFGWLKTFHTFSFGSYRDEKHMGFRMLRVINEDRVLAGSGFDTHPHSNMEILSYVVSGELEHKDSMGNGSIIKEGEFQVITAGTGITHSEFNPSTEKGTHFYQMWVIPDTQDLSPSYGQIRWSSKGAGGGLKLIACKTPANGALKVNQDVKLYCGCIARGESVKLPLKKERFGWLQVVKGELNLEGSTLKAGDGASLSSTELPEMTAQVETEILFFDLA